MLQSTLCSVFRAFTCRSRERPKIILDERDEEAVQYSKGYIRKSSRTGQIDRHVDGIRQVKVSAQGHESQLQSTSSWINQGRKTRLAEPSMMRFWWWWIGVRAKFAHSLPCRKHYRAEDFAHVFLGRVVDPARCHASVLRGRLLRYRAIAPYWLIVCTTRASSLAAMGHRAVEHRVLEHRVLEHRVLEHRVLEHRVLEHRVLEHRAVEHKITGYRANYMERRKKDGYIRGPARYS